MNDPRCKFWVKGRTSVFPFQIRPWDRIPAFQLTGHMEWEIITQSWETNSNRIQELAALILKAADGERMETPFPLWSLIFPPLRTQGQLKNSTAKNDLDQKKSWTFILSGNTFFCSVVDLAEGWFISVGLKWGELNSPESCLWASDEFLCIVYNRWLADDWCRSTLDMLTPSDTKIVLRGDEA